MNSDDTTYRFAGDACLRWGGFCLLLVLVCLLVVVLRPHSALVWGLVPGWLFGSFGAAFFAFIGSSWIARALYRGPALVVNDAGIQADWRLGGPTTPWIRGGVSWSEVASVLQGPRGTVLLELSDPDAFWQRQPWRTRLAAWSPFPGRRRLVPLGGVDLAADGHELFSLVETRWKAALAAAEAPPQLAGDADPGDRQG